MMTGYFKCVRPDGRDFHTGTVDYAAALASGELVTHPNPGRRDAGGYLSVSVSAADCTGMEWPCRLFEVEPVDPWAPDPAMLPNAMLPNAILPNKRACHSLRVVRELPAHEALGPQGVHVAALIDRTRSLTADETGRLAAAQGAALDAALDAVRAAALDAALDAVRAAARDGVWAAALDAAWGAAWALVVRDLISADHYDTLTQPWASVIGKVHPDDPDTTPKETT